MHLVDDIVVFVVRTVRIGIRTKPFQHDIRSPVWTDTKNLIRIKNALFSAPNVRRSAKETEDTPTEYIDQSLLEVTEPISEPVSIDYPEITTKTQVSEMKGWAPQDVIEKVGPLFTADQKKTGILASVSLAQFIVESGYGQSRLSLEANNCFGIKGYPGQSTWYGSAWDGESVYNINTNEQTADGSTYVVYDSFRKYDCMEDSIEDHSAYLRSSMNGDKLRYDGIIGCTHSTASRICPSSEHQRYLDAGLYAYSM